LSTELGRVTRHITQVNSITPENVNFFDMLDNENINE
jgi:hypothetical protein